jgi:hypothetical protein
MKQFATIVAGLCIVCACQKQNRPIQPLISSQSVPLTQVEQYLKDSLPTSTYDSLSFASTITTSNDTGRTYFMRVPFKGTPITDRFILIHTNQAYAPVKAAAIQITKDSTPASIIPSALSFYGTIRKSYLNGTLDYASSINGGYIQVLHTPKKVTLDEALDEQAIELPEIVIYAPDDDYDASFDLILDDGGGGGFDGYSPAASALGGGAGATSVGSYSLSEANEIQAAKPAIDLTAYFDCFNNVPNTAATTYSASLLVKVPDPTDPDIMWDPTQADGVGHTFMELTKSDGITTITQYIGFYGQGGVAYSAETAIGFSVPSKMVDNSGHPYNASLTVSLSGGQFADLLTSLQSYSMAKYNLSSYNCTTYALSAFNTVLPTALNPSPMAIPGQVAGDTPNGLFALMQTMPANGPDGQVAISNAPQTAGAGHGPCN